jgi:hypothetical protein
MSTTNITINTGDTSSASSSDSSESTPTSSNTDFAEKSELLSQFIDGAFADGSFSDNELEGMNAILTGDTSSDASSDSTDESSSDLSATDFMEQVNEIAQDSDPGVGPGERMMLDEANRLVEEGGSSQDMQKFLDTANDLLNNKDGNGDGPQDIDETHDGEGTMLRNLTTGLLADDDSSTDESGSSDSSSGNGNSAIGDFIKGAFADGSFSDNDLAGLQALVGTDESDSSSSASNSSEDADAANADEMISNFIKGAYAKGGFSDNELAGLKDLLASIRQSDPSVAA